MDLHNPEATKATPACRPNEWGANRSLVWVRNVKNIVSLHYMFHPDPIVRRHLVGVIGKAPDTYMQRFDVAGWAKGNTGQKHTLRPEGLQAAVLEFAALSEDADLLDAGNEQHFGLMGSTPEVRAWGSYEELRTGAHFEPEVHASRQADGTLVRTEETGAVHGVPRGAYTVVVNQAPYADAHGTRLRRMAEYLKENKGAVLACEDPIGIAQELSLHHLTAAVPYLRWLKEVDAKGVSNQWKQAASESIRTLRTALERKHMMVYADEADRMRDVRDAYAGSYPGSDSNQPVRLRRPDGSYEEVSLQELNRRRLAEQEARITAHEGPEPERKYAQEAMEKALGQIARYCDMGELAAFDKLHGDKLKARDALMDRISLDLQAWLSASALIDTALGRYDETADIDTSDGLRCAGQLCAILLQMDNSPRGRAWYGALDAFTPGRRNLVWRMLSLNNAELSAELHAALAQLKWPLPPAGMEVQQAEEKAQHQKAHAGLLAALGQVTKTLSATDKINTSYTKLRDPKLSAAWRAQHGMELMKTLCDKPAAVLGTWAMARFKALPGASVESHIAKAQMLLLARGMGQQAIAFGRQLEADALKGVTARQGRYMQRRMEKAIQAQIASTAGKDMRLPTVLLALNALALLPALANAHNKRDERTLVELAGTMASLAGSAREWRATLYEKAMFKQLPDVVPKVHRNSIEKTGGLELRRLKISAAHLVAAGAAVGVYWDAVDAITAHHQKEKLLTLSYIGRTATGIGTITTTLAGAYRVNPASLALSRINLGLAVLTAITTFAIGKLKGDAWANWLKAQPFRATLIRDDESTPARVENRSIHPMGFNLKLPHHSEQDMMNKLADCLAEID